MHDVDGVRQAFAGLDVYLFDQLVRGRIGPGARVFDAGCGRGRNVRWFLAAGHHVAGLDADPGAVAATRLLARDLQPAAPPERFRVATLEEADLGGERADLVICNAVLHFARDHGHFDAMLRGAWSAVAPGGLFFARLASSIGLDGAAPLSDRDDGRFRLPDGSERYLVDAARLEAAARELGGRALDPLKTTVVQDLRCMTTWVLERSA